MYAIYLYMYIKYVCLYRLIYLQWLFILFIFILFAVGHSLNMDTLKNKINDVNVIFKRIICAIDIQRQAMELVSVQSASNIYIIYIGIYIIFLSTQRYLDRLKWLHRLRRSRFYSTTIYYTLFVTLCLVFCNCLTLIHTLAYCLTLWLLFAALVLYTPKNDVTFQNCRLIAIYHLDESRCPASFRASTVFFPRLSLFWTRTHAHARRLL